MGHKDLEERSQYNKRYHKEHPRDRRDYWRRYYKEHREEQQAKNRRYREGHKEEIAAQRRHYREEHREEVLARKRRYYAENREECNARGLRWQRENPDKAAIYKARYKARKNGAPNTLTPEEAEQLFAIGRAVYAGKKLHLDHVVPVSKGGGTTLANMHAIPANLNCSKYIALPEDIYQQLTL